MDGFAESHEERKLTERSAKKHGRYIVSLFPKFKTDIAPLATSATQAEESRESRESRNTPIGNNAPWPCPHCGKPAEFEDVCLSLDSTRTLTLWHCEPCQTWGVTPSTLREPPVWVSKKEQ